MINNNITYIQTSIGLIPSDWELKKLKELGDFISGNGFPIDEQGGNTGIPFYKVSDMNLVRNENKMTVSNNYVSDEQIKKMKIKPITRDAIIFAKVGAAIYLERKRIAKNFVIDNNMMAFVPFKYSLFLKYYFDFLKLSKYAQTGALPAYNASDLKSIKIRVPNDFEQQKIASILLTWDNAIDINKNILSDLEIIKKGMTINVLSGKIRFKTFLKDNKISQRNGYTIPDDWEIKKLSSVLEQIKKPVKPEKDTLYKQLGIRSHTKGIFYKESVTGQSLGNKSVFAIEPDCFILNIVFAWEHAIAKTSVAELDMIVSHRFPMYKPLASKLDLDYLLFFFKSNKGKDLLGLASPGGAGRNKTLGQKEFLKLKIPIPPIKEQKAIALFLETYDSEIKLHQQKLQALRLQKKGLMQQLLTGKVRVKTNN